MRKLCSVLALFALVGVVQAGNVIVPAGNNPVDVEPGDTVRIPTQGIAGTQIEAKVTGGRAKLTENNIIEKAGNRPVIGSTKKEFEFKAEGKGNKVKVRVTITAPGQPAEVTDYEFNVK